MSLWTIVSLHLCPAGMTRREKGERTFPRGRGRWDGAAPNGDLCPCVHPSPQPGCLRAEWGWGTGAVLGLQEGPTSCPLCPEPSRTLTLHLQVDFALGPVLAQGELTSQDPAVVLPGQRHAECLGVADPLGV